MLVVTRRPQEKITFPALGITVQLLRLAAGRARIGIEAPADIKILREELPPSEESKSLVETSDHARANAINRVMLAVHLAQKQWEAGWTSEANTTLEKALQLLEKLHEPTTTQESSRRLKMLIVEDDDNERELLAGILQMHGCECTTAADGEDALAYLATERPDMVLLDMKMPRCDGPETLRRIRADNRLAGLRVFSLSSTSPRELNVPDGPTGFDGWFPKPLNPRRLWDAIQDALQSPVVTN